MQGYTRSVTRAETPLDLGCFSATFNYELLYDWLKEEDNLDPGTNDISMPSKEKKTLNMDKILKDIVETTLEHIHFGTLRR